MAEIKNTEWLEEYLSMWTPAERMGKIHKVTTFDPTYHCYPEGVYLLDDDCRAHTAIYVVDKNHNVHIIYDGMAWDLLARAVEEGANRITLQLKENSEAVVGALEGLKAVMEACCKGLQEKLERMAESLEGIDDSTKRIADNSDRMADAEEEIADNTKDIADNTKDIADHTKEIADKIDCGGGDEPTPSEPERVFFAEPDLHVVEEGEEYSSLVTSTIDGEEAEWEITDDVASYPDWATVTRDDHHVYINKQTEEPEPEPEVIFFAEPDEVDMDEMPTEVYAKITSTIDGEEAEWEITDDLSAYPDWAIVAPRPEMGDIRIAKSK